MTDPASDNVPASAPATAAAAIRDYPPGHRFEAVAEGRTAVATYTLGDDGTITFVHTVVPEPLRGRGIATKLVVAALASARELGRKVIPQCSVFDAYMRKHPETHDLLAPEGRAMLGL